MRSVQSHAASSEGPRERLFHHECQLRGIICGVNPVISTTHEPA